NGLREFWIAITEADVEAVSDVVAARVDFHLDVVAHRADNGFHRLATPSLRTVQVVLVHQRFERTSTRDHLRDAGELSRQTFLAHRWDDAHGQGGRPDDDERS